MKLKDITAMVAKGYKIDEVKELISISKENEKSDSELMELVNSGCKLSEIKELIELSKDTSENKDEQNVPENDDQNEDTSENKDDIIKGLKKQIEDLRKSELTKDISKAGNEKSDEDILNEALMKL